MERLLNEKNVKRVGCLAEQGDMRNKKRKDTQHERDCKWQKLKTLQVKNESQNYRTHSAE